jgi:hypothetical protein
MSLSLDKEQKRKVIRCIKKEIKDNSNCRVGWALKKEIGLEYETSYHILDKIANTMIKSVRYLKERPTEPKYKMDWNIYYNSKFKLTVFNICTVIINIILTIVFFTSISSKENTKAESFVKKVEHQLDSLSKSSKIDSLSKDGRDSTLLEKKKILQKYK